MSYLVIAIAVLLLGAFAFFANKRFKAADLHLFKSRITRTVGSVNVVNVPYKLNIVVHELGRQQPGSVHVEFHREGTDSYQITPLTMSKNEALTLAELLKDAASPA